MIGSEDNFDEKYSSIFSKEETPSESNVVNPSEDSTPQVSKPEETPAITQERKVLSIPAWEKDQDVTYFKILGRNSLLSTESVLFVDKTSNFIYDDIIAAHVVIRFCFYFLKILGKIYCHEVRFRLSSFNVQALQSLDPPSI